MSTYVIGDLQGCFATLQALLRKIQFRSGRDQLWFVGDLVNRGTGSLACLRFVHGLGDDATVVLGNHDLHLLAVAEGLAKPHRLDTLDAILHASDRDTLLDWLRHRPLLHLTPQFALVHAGIMPDWRWAQAQTLATEVSRRLRGPDYRNLLGEMYGDQPTRWAPDLDNAARHRFALNTFTRMRALTTAGAHSLKFKSTLADMPTNLVPWFRLPSVRRTKRTILAGHWSALGLHREATFVGLDTGCIWGGALTAYRLEDGKVFQMPADAADLPPGLAAEG